MERDPPFPEKKSEGPVSSLDLLVESRVWLRLRSDVLIRGTPLSQNVDQTMFIHTRELLFLRCLQQEVEKKY